MPLKPARNSLLLRNIPIPRFAPVTSQRAVLVAAAIVHSMKISPVNKRYARQCSGAISLGASCNDVLCGCQLPHPAIRAQAATHRTCRSAEVRSGGAKCMFKSVRSCGLE